MAYLFRYDTCNSNQPLASPSSALVALVVLRDTARRMKVSSAARVLETVALQILDISTLTIGEAVWKNQQQEQ